MTLPDTKVAMLLAAGRGERMRPLSDHCPKPLLTVADVPMIARLQKQLLQAGVHRYVINTCWLGAQIEDYFTRANPALNLSFSREVTALESGGGLAHALPLLRAALGGEGWVIVCAADVVTDYDFLQLVQRAVTLDFSTSSAHLVLVPNPPFQAQGVYSLLADGRVSLDGEAPLTWASFGLFHTRALATIPDTKTPLAPYLHDWIAQGRVSGEVFTGLWDNVGTPEQLAQLNAAL